MPEMVDLFGDIFQTVRSPQTLFCHLEFLEKLEANRNHPTGKRASLLLQRMLVDLRRMHFKATYGPNRGWRRSRLGGNFGSHYYAWWMTPASPPAKQEGSYDSAPKGAVFLRDIRHHDDHSPLSAGNWSDQYLALSVNDVRKQTYAPEPFTTNQSRFAKSKLPVRVLKGHPGSGKTTALLHAADQSMARKVLYLTFSPELVALARDYFDCYCDAERQFSVMTFPAFMHQILGVGAPALVEEREAREKFRKDTSLDRRGLGPWASDPMALYDEFHAHLTGAALPEDAGRFPKAEKVRLPDKEYLKQRVRFIGQTAASAALETAKRLERNLTGPLVDHYFPDLAVAWRAAHRVAHHGPLADAAFEDFGCLAIDECQDLTPLESFVVLSYAKRLNRKHYAPVLMAGDEAQTVRPTDFEWAWLSDMLHAKLSTPMEFKLSANLRSPRGIATLVNRAAELYSHLDKKDRPSGDAKAEIDDDSPDQILYCTSDKQRAIEFLEVLTAREGCAVIALNPERVPEKLQSAVLTVEEAKGLDFQTVCVLDAGETLSAIVAPEIEFGVATLAVRLNIDKLRVALSRPTERLIWLDIDPTQAAIIESSRFLRADGYIAMPPVTVDAVEQNLGEEDLDLEERLQRCQRDARQFVAVKPDMAWSRAQQAVYMLGRHSDVITRIDESLRRDVYMTLAEVCFRLATKKARLSPQLGKLDMFRESADAASYAGVSRVAAVIRSVGNAERATLGERLQAVASLMQMVSDSADQLEGWLKVELAARADDWSAELERHLEAGANAALAGRMLPSFYKAVGLPDSEARSGKLLDRCLQILMRTKQFGEALALVHHAGQKRPRLEAECYEGTGNFEMAASVYEGLGESEKALKCYRSKPDFENALRLVKTMKDHPAAESLEWLASLDEVVRKRPEKFGRVMTAPEKKLLQETLERALGVQKRKPTPRKAAAKKAAPGKAAPRKAFPKSPYF